MLIDDAILLANTIPIAFGMSDINTNGYQEYYNLIPMDPTMHSF
jgi:hypothetical protein